MQRYFLEIIALYCHLGGQLITWILGRFRGQYQLTNGTLMVPSKISSSSKLYQIILQCYLQSCRCTFQWNKKFNQLEQKPPEKHKVCQGSSKTKEGQSIFLQHTRRLPLIPFIIKRKRQKKDRLINISTYTESAHAILMEFCCHLFESS